MDGKKTLQITEQDRQLIGMACELASQNMEKGGGPFGAVIARNGELISTGCNTVALTNDPTAHAEVNAIRNACAMEKNSKLEGCAVYCSCEPCPMCLSALYLAGVERIYYANTRNDARDCNADTDLILSEIARPETERPVPSIHIPYPHAIDHLRKWTGKFNKNAH